MSGHRPGRGVLVILALLLASSGAIRVGTGFGMALALAPDAAEQSGQAAAAAPECPPHPLALADALSLRESRVAAQEAAIADRAAALALADERITRRLEELATAATELEATVALADGAAEQDLTRLTAVYEAMKPKDAALLFEAMAPDFAAGFLGRMSPAAAGAIMAGMPPETAYGISVILAGRNVNAPRN